MMPSSIEVNQSLGRIVKKKHQSDSQSKYVKVKSCDFRDEKTKDPSLGRHLWIFGSFRENCLNLEPPKVFGRFCYNSAISACARSSQWRTSLYLLDELTSLSMFPTETWISFAKVTNLRALQAVTNVSRLMTELHFFLMLRDTPQSHSHSGNICNYFALARNRTTTRQSVPVREALSFAFFPVS